MRELRGVDCDKFGDLLVVIEREKRVQNFDSFRSTHSVNLNLCVFHRNRIEETFKQNALLKYSCVHTEY